MKKIINKINEFICCKWPEEKFGKYEKVIMFLALFVLVLVYMAIFVYNHIEKRPKFSWQLYPFFIALYLPLIHSLIYHIKNKTFKIHNLDVPLLMYLLFCIISTIVAPKTKNALMGNGIRNEGLFSIIFYVLVYFLGRNMVNSKNVLKLINLIFGFGLLQVITGITQATLKIDAYYDEMAYGFTGNPNMFGLLMGMLLTTAVSLAFNKAEEINKYRKFYFICAISFYIGLILAESSAPFFVFIALLAVIIVYYLIKKTKTKNVTMFVLTIIMLFPIVQFGNGYINQKYYESIKDNPFVSKNVDYTKLYTDITKIVKKIVPIKTNVAKENSQTGQTTSNSEQQGLMHGRLEIWKLSLNTAFKNWRFGVGMDSLYILWNTKYPVEIIDKAHNQYIDIFASIGIYGCTVYVVFIIGAIYVGIKTKSEISKSIFFGFLFYSIAIGAGISTPFVAVYYYLITGMFIGLDEKNRREYGKS